MLQDQRCLGSYTEPHIHCYLLQKLEKGVKTMKQAKCNLKSSLLVVFLILSLFLNLQVVYAQYNPNTITLDNKSGEIGIVKLIGPTGQTAEVPNGQSRTVNVAPGEYYILVRYGNKPEAYKYAKGDPFTVTQTTTQYSATTVTLHKVVGGNYPTHPISAEEFEQAATGEVVNLVHAPEAIPINELYTQQRARLTSIQTLSVKVSMETPEGAKEKVNNLIRQTVKKVFSSVGFILLLEGEEEKADAILQINGKVKALSASYTRVGNRYTGAKTEGKVSIEKEGMFSGVPFSANTNPPWATSGGYETSDAAPFDDILGITGLDIDTDRTKSFHSALIRTAALLRNWTSIVTAVKQKDGLPIDWALWGAVEEKVPEAYQLSVIALREGDEDAKWALTTLGGARAVSIARQVLNEKNDDTSRIAASILQELKAEEAVNDLSLLAKDPQRIESVRIASLEALKTIGGEKALSTAREIISNQDSPEKVRVKAVEIIIVSKDSSKTNSLRKIVKNLDEPPILRDKALSAIAKLDPVGAPSLMLEVVRELNNEPDLREKAVIHLKGSKHLPAFATLESIIANVMEPLSLRQKSVESIVSLDVGQSLSVLSNIAENQNNDPKLRETALNHLSKLKEKQLEGLFVRITSDKNDDTNLRILAVEGLKELVATGAINVILEVAGDKNEDEGLRIACIETLCVLKEQRIVRPLIKMVKDRKEFKEIRLKAIKSLPHVDQASARILLSELSDPDEDIREAIVERIRQVGGIIVNDLIDILKTKEPAGRAKAADLLGELSDRRATKPLIELLKDNDVSVIIASIKSLAKLGDRRATIPLTVSLQNPDPSAKLEVIQALSKLRDRRAKDPLKRFIETTEDEKLRKAAEKAIKELELK